MSVLHLLERLGPEVTVMIERTIQLWPWACVLAGIAVLLLLGPISALAADESPMEGNARNELFQDPG
jgi:hypothetical protein